MQLIKKIEVNYLRSLYTATFSDVGDLNIVFGRNDSGKSNFLRALNLFFNDEVEQGKELDFDLDISDSRKEAARQAKGRQFIWIKITFNIPENYARVLGSELTVKRQWNRDGNMNETVFPSLDTPGEKARLTRFLNDIDFTYIPAIKDLTVFADLIERIYAAAAESIAIQNATSRFVEAIGARTKSLSDQLSAMFDGPAKLSAPAEMSTLFRNLDFAHGEDAHSLIRQKGDGVKARHIPEMLHFINQIEARPKFYLWGFEEPENSLDIKSAEIEAKRFAEIASRSDTQIFITSHSPAFYLSENEDTKVSRYFVSKQKVEDGTPDPFNAVSEINSLELAEVKMEGAGLLQLPYVIRRTKELQERLAEREQEALEVREALAQLEAPTLFVEGVHDVSLFQDALTAAADGRDIQIRPLGGAPETVDSLISAILLAGGLQARQRAYFLFDNDKPGRAAYRKLVNHNDPSARRTFGDGKFVRCLPTSAEYRNFLDRYNIPRDRGFFTGEFVFDIQEAADLCSELIAGREAEFEAWLQRVNGQYFDGIGQDAYLNMLRAERGSPDWLFVRGVPDALKHQFSHHVVERDIACPLVDEIVADVVDALLTE